MMETKREALWVSRFLLVKRMKKNGLRAPQGEEAKEPERDRPGVAQCTRYMQRRVAERLPGIVDELLEKSKNDAATLKALWQMGKLDEQGGAARKRKGSLAREVLRER